MATTNMRVAEEMEKAAQEMAKRLSEVTGANVPATDVTKLFAQFMKENNGGKGMTILPVVVVEKQTPAPPRGRPPFLLKV